MAIRFQEKKIIHLHNKKGTTIMKKTYQSPELTILFLTQHLMQSASLGKSNTTVSSNSAVLSRRDNDFWDDDEEE